MTATWREVLSWSCEACDVESLLVESEDWRVKQASVFERRCTSCGAAARGTTIRPAGVHYDLTTRRDFYPKARYSTRRTVGPTQVP